MKFLKLLGVFLALCALLFGLYMLVKTFSGGDSVPAPPQLTDEVVRESQNLTDDWENAVYDWQPEIFDKHAEMLKQLKAQYPDRTEHIRNLSEMNCRYGLQRIDEKITEQWKKPNCDKAVIEKYVSGVNTIVAADGDFANDNCVKKIKRIYGVYTDALTFANSSFGCSPKFNGATGTWNSFSAYATNITKKRDKIRNNADYQHNLSNISVIKTGLNSTEQKLSNAKSNFYTTLFNEITKYYDNIPVNDRNDDVRQKLADVAQRFARECPNSGLTAKLNTFKNNY